MVYCYEPPLRPIKSQRQENVPTHTFTPRTFQVELLDTALQHNTIACLATDAGKTFISALLIKELAHQVRGSATGEDPQPCRTVFMVNSVSMAEQQAQVLRLHTDLQVGAYLELDEARQHDTDFWHQQVKSHQLLMVLPSVALHLLQEGHLTLSSVNLLVFDECHLVMTAEHPYAAIMEMYHSHQDSQPRILGLTASILQATRSSPQQLENTLNALEQAMCSTAETATDLIVSDLYGARPLEVFLDCEDYTDPTDMGDTLNTLLESAIMFLRDCAITAEEDDEPDPLDVPRAVLIECQETLSALGPWACGHVAQYFTTQVSALEEQEALSSHQRLLQFCLTQLRVISTITERAYEKDVQVLEDFMTYMKPKVLQVIDILHNYKPDDNFMIIGDETLGEMDDGEETDSSLDLSDHEFAEPEPERKKKDDGQKPQVHYVAVKKPDLNPKAEDESLCGVIFVARPHTAFVLNKLIQEVCNWDPDLFFIKSSHLTGHGFAGRAARSHQAELQCRKQEEILRKFRNKELNLLVATPEVEEGVDMPRCNLVMRFELPHNYRSYVQSKGRARARVAHYYMLVEESRKESFMTELQTYKGIEKILMRKCENTDEFRFGAPEGVVFPLAPYRPQPGEESAQVTMETAIALVNRYCAKLPSDAFTHLTAKCTIREQLGDGDGAVLYQASLQLPINSPIKQPIEGEVMPSRQMAKMAVALKACEILHKNGELDDNLQPVGKEVIKYEDEEGEWEDHELAGQARPGTTKRKQYYNKNIAQSLLGTPPNDSRCFLYEIHMTLTCSITEEQNTRGRRIHAPEDTPRCFAIISQRALPLVPNFPVFTRSGEVTVSIEMVRSDVTLTSAEIKRLQEFHHVVFRRVLRLEKDPMLFCPASAQSSYIVVPLTSDKTGSRMIDWTFVKHVENSPLPAKRPELYSNERPKFEFDETVFEDAVVMPSYRNMDQPQYFYVAEIRHDLTPRSPFPSPEVYSTFEQYYTAKYGLKITNLDQPLLDVDHTSARLNLLTPRYMNQKGVALPTSSAETRRQRRENLQQKQILVPELCDVHPFPASLWRKAVCLPAILYRTNCLLIAEELRKKIAVGAQVGRVELPEGFRFDELEFGFSTKPGDGEVPNSENVEEDKSKCDDDDDQSEDVKLNSEDVNQVEPSSESDCGNGQDNLEKDVKNNKLSDVSNVKNEKESYLKLPSKDNDSEPVSEPLPSQPAATQSNLPKQESSKPVIEDVPESSEQTENEKNTSKTQPGVTKEEIVIVMDQKHVDIPVEMTNGVLSDSETAEDSNEKWEIDLKALGMDNMLGGLTISEQNHDSTIFGEDSNWNTWQADDNQAKPGIKNPNHGATTDRSKDTLTENPNGLVGANMKKVTNNHDASLQHQKQSSKTVEPSAIQITACHQTGDKPLSEPLMVGGGGDGTHISTSVHDSGSDSGTQHSTTSSSQGTSGRNAAATSCSGCHGNTHPAAGPEPCSCSSQTASSQCQCHAKSDCDNHPTPCPTCSPPLSTSLDTASPNNHDNQGDTSPCNAPVNDSSTVCVGCGMSAESGVPTDPPTTAPSTSCVGHPTSAICCPDGCTTHTPHGICKNPPDRHAQGHDLTEPPSLSSHSASTVAVFTQDACDCGSSLCMKCEYQRKVAVAERIAKEAQQDCTPLISFESEVDLKTFIGPSPCLLLQALTMSNANDFFNLERLETIGDSFLKFAITVYLYCTYPGIHEGKLSYLRSKQVSNYNLYRLGKRCKLPELMVAAKFEPAENWLPPGFVIKKNNAYSGLESLLERQDGTAAGDAGKSADSETDANTDESADTSLDEMASEQVVQFNRELAAVIDGDEEVESRGDGEECPLQGLIPYKLQTQHSLPDKSIADCVEALIGCYLTTCGARAALQFMSWLGLKVLPEQQILENADGSPVCKYGQLVPPSSPLLTHLLLSAEKMEQQLHGYSVFEDRIGYHFKDRAYLLQAFTHASYHYNHSTDCYQRLEFLGDAILDYVITRHLFEDERKHSPGILTDLRSALVNNNIFAALAVKWDFHKYFKAVSPQLFHVIDKFVSWQKERNDEINLDEEFEDLDEDQDRTGEDIEIPKALGDIFESVAGAIYLDSGMSLDTVWRVYYRLMKPQIDTFTERIPKSPVRELLEMEPETAKFEKPERTLDGKIRVTVNVVDKGQFKGVGRNYRIAKSAAARRALKYIRMVQQMAEQQGSQPGYHLPFLDGMLCGQRPAGPSGGVPFIDWGTS